MKYIFLSFLHFHLHGSQRPCLAVVFLPDSNLGCAGFPAGDDAFFAHGNNGLFICAEGVGCAFLFVGNRNRFLLAPFHREAFGF